MPPSFFSQFTQHSRKTLVTVLKKSDEILLDASKNFDEIVGFVRDCYYGNVRREAPKELEISKESGG
jgi:hypothetical protein